MSQFIEMFGDPMVNDKQWSEYSCISEITQIVLGSTPNSKEPSYWDGDIRWITPAEMTDQSYYIFDTVRHITDEGRKAANLTVLPEGTVLFSTRAPIGKVAIVGKEMCCNQGFKNFICSEKLNNVFLYYTLKLKKDYLCSLGTGTTFKELSKRTVESLKIAVPPIELQNQFETIYNQADKSGFDGLKSQFIEMFGTAESAMPLADFIEVSFPGEWGQEDKDGTGVKVIRTTNFTNNGKLDLSDVVTRDIDSAKIEKKKLSKGDIILERSGGTNDNPVGRVVYFEEDGLYLFNNFTQLLRCKEGVNSLFVFYSLFNYYQMNKNVIRSMGNKTTGIQNLKMDRYWQIPIADVSIERQKEFETIYRQADKSGSVLQHMIAC